MLPATKYFNDKYNDDEVEIHDCGPMDVACQYCEALHFPAEKPIDGKFTTCCHKGKVILPPKREFPEYIKDIMSNPNHPDYKNFNENIRNYNSSMSFASMGAKTSDLSNKGPYCFRVCGQIYHCTSNIHPNDNESRQYAQLYVVDSSEANIHRKESRANVKCVTEIIANLDKIIRENNAFAKAYQMLGEIEMKEKERLGTEDTPDVNLIFKRDRNDDRRRYNLPAVDEVAMVFKNSDGEPPFERDFKVYPYPNQPMINLNILSPNLDPMTYPLFYPYGEPGWQPGIELMINENVQKSKISMLQYKVAQTAIREGIFNPLLYGGKLFQQWIVDSYLQVEANNLNYIKQNQLTLKAEQYRGLHDHLANVAEKEGLRVGKTVILPSTFQGSKRNMNERYQDAMSLVGQFDKPDFFITMTCNPYWQEIKENLLEGQKPSDRPDLISRVFNLKLKSCMDDILKGEVFGKTVAHCYAIEFQKRGLPHAHILIILEKDHKLNAEDYDKIVCAELPDEILEPKLFKIVTGCMIHGPCGKEKEDAMCMENGKCSKGYPKNFNPVTKKDTNGYPEYRRRQAKSCIVNRNTVTNRNVIPYNKFLAKKYNCHINVEICMSFNSIKYLFKYVYKGYDCIKIAMQNIGEKLNYDEVKDFIDARYVCAPEAMWRLLENRMHGISHHIIRLAVHLEREQMIYFKAGNERAALEKAQHSYTHLTAWFKLNNENEEARQYLYPEIPYHYTFDNVTNTWQPRKQGKSKVIPRIYSVSPNDVERYFLRLLLLNVPGARSFEEIRTVDEITYDTYKKAAAMRNLIMDDNQWKEAMEEATLSKMPYQLRQMFAFICVFNNIKDPMLLYEDFKESLIEDYYQKNPHGVAESLALLDIDTILKTHNSSCSNIGLPNPVVLINNLENVDTAEQAEKAEKLRKTLNENQRIAFENITAAVLTPHNEDSKCFFLDGPAGSGKTYVYNTLMSYLRGKNKTVLAFATTGIAADLLEKGQTMHSGFGIPIPLLDNSSSKIKVPSIKSQALRNASILIIDEASSIHKNALHVIDNLLREILEINEPFGGKVIVLGGDFRQTANIILHGNNIDVIEASIKTTYIWRRYFKIYHLTENMRAAGDFEFNEWLLKVGDGRLNIDETIEIPKEMIVTNDLVKEIFGSHLNLNEEDIQTRAILTPTNKDALKINNHILDQLPGEEKTYASIDSIIDETEELSTNFPLEFLNRQNPTGLSPHILKLKIGAVIMLIRNMNISKGLLNGTRLIIQALHNNFIEAKIITGSNKGDVVFIPRIDLESNENALPFKMKRRQFPVIPAFAITINKSQGQTYETVGIYLPTPVFSHGQLYVALSRCKNRENIKIYIEDNESQGQKNFKFYTKNIVIKELLE